MSLNAPGQRMTHDTVSPISILLCVILSCSIICPRTLKNKKTKSKHKTLSEKLFKGKDMGPCISIDKIKPSGEQLSLRLEHKRARI